MSNDEITLFCSGDLIISFTACFAVGFSSLQPASSINRSTAALVIRVHLRDLIRAATNLGPTGRSVCEAVHTLPSFGALGNSGRCGYPPSALRF